MKVCTKCNKNLPENDFFKSSSGKNGLMSWCKICHGKSNKRYKALHRDRLNAIERKRYKDNPQLRRNQKFRERYGITTDEYDQMFAAQKGKCAICSNTSKKRLCVDYDHKTGKVRELLCNNCNWAVGCVKEDVKIANKLVKYVEKYSK